MTEASARGARQWRCAGEEQLQQAQGGLANGDVLVKISLKLYILKEL